MTLIWPLLMATAAAAPAAQIATQLPPVESITLEQDKARRMTVGILLDGKGPYRFLVDTGAERTVISREVATEIALRPAGSAKLIGVMGTETVDLVHVGAMTIDRYRSAALRAPTLSHASIGGAGMVGIDSLQRQRVTLDFRNRLMTIEPAIKRPPPPLPDSTEIVVKARALHGRMVIMNARVDGAKVAVVLDTGSQTTLGNEALRRKLARRRDAREQPIILTDITGSTLAARYTFTHSVEIEGIRLSAMPIALADAPIFNILGLDDQPAMLLGMDALHLFERVSIDFSRRQARFSMADEG